MKDIFPEDRPWPLWQRCLFRFLFIFMILLLDPVSWIAAFVPENFLTSTNDTFRDAAVEWGNRVFFHVRPVLVHPMGSGDTSWSWAAVCLWVCVSVLLAIAWSILDRRRPSYIKLGYWFRTYLRYYFIVVASLYGSFKMNLSQMGKLGLVDMATPVGNLSLMRMCWYFMAASPPYQFFSGCMEMLVAILLLYRRTVTLGLVLGLAVFSNVMMLNYAYDIPVKIFSTELVLCCIVLLFRDYRRILSFFILNKTAPPGRLYEPVNSGKNFRIARWVVKAGFIVFVLIIPVWKRFGQSGQTPTIDPPKDFHYGVYQVNRFLVNGDSAQGKSPHPWTTLVFDRNGRGAIFSDSALFKFRYGRSNFGFTRDTFSLHGLQLSTGFSDDPADRDEKLNLSYETLENGRVRFRTRRGDDSLLVDAKLTDTVYPLGQRKFHWLTEYVP